MKKLLLGLTLGATALAAPTAAWAQDDAAEDPNTGALTFSGGVDFTHAYYFRGYLQENDGVIAQPYFTLGTGIGDNLTAYVATWNSIHSEQTGGDDAWYESDIYGGIDLAIDPLVIGVVYTFYTYPNGAFDTIQEIGAKLTFDESKVFEDTPVVFKPYVAFFLETDDGNGSEDSYLEAGANPGFTMPGTDLAITVPIVVGMSVDDYYFDEDGDEDFLGYGAIGLATSIPLPLPARYGSWSLNGSVKYLYLFSDGLEAANEGDKSEIIGTLGISFSY